MISDSERLKWYDRHYAMKCETIVCQERDLETLRAFVRAFDVLRGAEYDSHDSTELTVEDVLTNRCWEAWRAMLAAREKVVL